MKYKYLKSRVNWLANTKRKELNEYIERVTKLFDEAVAENNERNIQIFGLWLSDALFERKKRETNKKLYLDEIKKRQSN